MFYFSLFRQLYQAAWRWRCALAFEAEAPYNILCLMEEKLSLTEVAESFSLEDEGALKTMFEAGLHWGRRGSLTHPKMRPFIFFSRGELEIIDLSKTLAGLQEALKFIREEASGEGRLLLVGTQPAARKEVREVAESLDLPYVNNRWLGGTLTNFKTIQNRIKHLSELEEKMKSPDFAHYTKKERIGLEKTHRELLEKFQGIVKLKELPLAIFVFGVKRHATAVREARRRGVKVVALANTSDDPTLVDYLIPGNESSSTSIKYVLDEIKKTVEGARKISPLEEPVKEPLPAETA
ncbi:MAG: 30S ribosomal protein S2 [Parcubacteria group bacterium]|nr:30S ribosomal protein S2 [Parcubacteria group bacterium]